MANKPTYTAQEIKEKVMQVDDLESYKILANLLEEEIDLYGTEDLAMLADASMKLFIKSLLYGAGRLK